METIRIKATDVSPEVIFSPEDKKYMIAGWSRPESPFLFYAPIIKWIEDYGEKHLNNATVDFKMGYFNTPSVRVIRKILDQLAQLHQKGVKMTVNWYYDNEGSKEEFVHEFATGLALPVNYIQKH